jgi:hypothetical protein
VFADWVMLSATMLALESMVTPALAQTLKDWKCTGDTDIPWDEQIAGCADAIKSGKYTGKPLEKPSTTAAMRI